MFKKICIIGCGLIGSSILRAANNKKLSQIVSVYDKSNEVLRFLKNQKLTDYATDDIKIAVKNSELTIISSPLSAYKEIISKIKNDFNENSILTDTGSVKRIVNKIIEESNLKNVSWIASHPIAGTEESGPASGFADLFQNRWNIICPSKNAKKSHVKILEKFWKTLGSNTKIMSFDEHDKILSLTSHLPHAIAYNIVRTSLGSDQRVRDEVIKYSAGGLRDFTRIASSDPLMWRDIFIDNSENIIEILNQFSENIEKFKGLIKQKKGEELFKIFESTKKVRKAIIDEGQDIDKPDFGRKKIK
tara:strand:+ start:11213 stop:12121 length:909 start_codon:yes stop_codon:yes gene_type:complete